MEAAMARTLILFFHPDPAHSKANAALAAAASALPDTDVVDMQALYPDGAIDAGVEARRLLSAGRIVLQFPVQWYSTPPLLKAWQDAVLTRMFYLAHETEGRLLEGTPILVAATAGNVEQAYAPGGANLFPLEDLLRPLQAMANRCRLPWSAPFLLYRANRLDEEALRAAALSYRDRLEAWRAETADGPEPQPSCSAMARVKGSAPGQPVIRPMRRVPRNTKKAGTPCSPKRLAISGSS
jgi:putative NADPH-quinone reductase